MGKSRKIEDWFDRRIAQTRDLDKLPGELSKSVSSRIKFPASIFEKDENEKPTTEPAPKAKAPSIKKVREVNIGERFSKFRERMPIPDFKGHLQKKQEGVDKPSTFDPKYAKIRTGDLADIIVENPVPALGLMVLLTIFFLFQIISIDLDKDAAIPISNNLNIHGETTVYLPENNETSNILEEVREYWSTDILVFFVQINDPDNNKVNITNPVVLNEISYIEETLDPDKSDRGANDEVVYCFSISTLIKEVNSSAPRLYNATIKNLAVFIEQTGGVQVPDELLRDMVNIDPVGGYSIPNNQDEIDAIVNNIPENMRKKFVKDTNDDGIWDTTVAIMGVVEEAGENPKPMIEKAENAVATRPQRGSTTTITVTGTLPLTDWGTDIAFHYYGILMPVAMVFLVAVILFFHRSLKAVFIAGFPTGASVVWIYGLLAMFDVIVTPTIIILGPVLLALGMSYGMHIANRFSQEIDPSYTERARITLKTTGNAVLMSAVTTMMGFFSLAFGELKPVTTVGWSLTGGIFFCFILSYIMSPTLCILTKYEKKTLEKEGKKWRLIARIPTHNSKKVLAVFGVLVLLSLACYPLVERDTDLMENAPNRSTEYWGSDIEGYEKLDVMKTYSEEFNSGALGMLIVKGQLRSDDYLDDSQDPVANLKQIELIEDDINDIPNQNPDLPVNAIGLVSILKAIGGTGSISTKDIWIIGELVPIEVNMSQSNNFWDLLNSPAVYNNKPLQKFLLNVFYDTLSNESKGMVINEYREGYPEYYERTLIYVDMPVLSDKEGHEAVGRVDEIAVGKPHGNVVCTKLTGVAAIAIAVNDLLIDQQIQSIIMSIVLVFIVLSVIFKSPKMGLITTIPVMIVLGFLPGVMYMLGVPLNLATVMIGSTVIGAGVDFSVHITQRMMEKGLNIRAIENSVAKAGPALLEATLITLGGLCAAFFGPMPSIYSFIGVIMILLFMAAVASILILPAIFTIYCKSLETKEALEELEKGEEAAETGDWDVEWKTD